MPEAGGKRPVVPERLLLDVANLGQSAAGQPQQGGQFRVAERGLLARALNLDETSAAGHDDVHVDLGRHVLGVIQIEHGLAIHDPHADCRHAVAQGRNRQTWNCFDRIDQCNHRAGNAGRARSAVGFQHVTVDKDRPLAQGIQIDNRAQASPNESLDFGRAAVDFADIPSFSRAGAARKHAVFGRDPAAALSGHPRRNLKLDASGTQHGRAARRDQHAAGRGAGVTALNGNRSQHVAGAAIVAHRFDFSGRSGCWWSGCDYQSTMRPGTAPLALGA